MITGNVHDHLRGRRVRALVTGHRAWDLSGDPHAGTSGLIMLSGTYHNDIELALGGGK